VAARGSAPVLGALCEAPHSKKKSSLEDEKGPAVSDDQRITSSEIRRSQPWVITMSYRFQPSSRHFIGTVEQKQREVTGTQIQNIYHLFDVAIERQLTRRFSATASIPFLFAYRNQLYNPRGEYRVQGIGDMTIGGRPYSSVRRPKQAVISQSVSV